MPSLEDFYDVAPLEAVFVGGPWAGRRAVVPDQRARWLAPVEVEAPLVTVDVFVAELEDPVGQVIVPASRAVVYYLEGIDDDGARRYVADETSE